MLRKRHLVETGSPIGGAEQAQKEDQSESYRVESRAQSAKQGLNRMEKR
jgi:hypothetical protein